MHWRWPTDYQLSALMTNSLFSGHHFFGGIYYVLWRTEGGDWLFSQGLWHIVLFQGTVVSAEYFVPNFDG
jgi:hypothetical protein